MKIIIPAAGYATRLGELSKDKPKHLLAVGEETIISRVMRGIKTIPVSDVFIVTNDRFYNYFKEWKDNFDIDLNIHILNDGTRSNEDRLGAVGDIWHVVQEAKIDDDLFIIAGDNLYCEEEAGYNLLPLHNAFKQYEKKAGVVGLYDVGSLDIAKHMNQITFIDGKEPPVNGQAQMMKIVEKDPNPVSTLIAVMIEIYPKSTIEHLKEYIQTTEQHDKMGQFRGWLIEKNKISVYGFHLAGRWFDIGLQEELKEARKFYDKK